MSADPWPEGVGRVVLDSVDSTNAEATRRAATLDRPTWIMARAQTAARGRRGRAWAMPRGNFAASLVMRPPGDAAAAGLRSFVAALALADALVAVTGRTQGVALKWPNDVLLNGGKLAGILLESAGGGGRIAHLVVGIGVNLAAAPGRAEVAPDALRPVSLLAETGARVLPDDFLPHLALAFARWEARLLAEGFGPLRAAFLDRAAHRPGAEMRARTGTDVVSGRFETIDATGALVLATSVGARAIAAADVFFGGEGGHAAGD